MLAITHITGVRTGHALGCSSPWPAAQLWCRHKDLRATLTYAARPKCSVECFCETEKECTCEVNFKKWQSEVLKQSSRSWPLPSRYPLLFRTWFSPLSSSPLAFWCLSPGSGPAHIQSLEASAAWQLWFSQILHTSAPRLLKTGIQQARNQQSHPAWAALLSVQLWLTHRKSLGKKEKEGKVYHISKIDWNLFGWEFKNSWSPSKGT